MNFHIMILSTFVKAFIIRIKFYYNDIFDHLETIYKRKLTENNNDYVNKLDSYELILYLNGELEQGIGDSYFKNDSGITINTITIYEGNYSFNLFDISYFNHPEEFNDNYVCKYLNDIDITQYYYNYKKLSYDIPPEDFNNELNNFLVLYNNIAPLFKTVDYVNSTDLEEINASVIKLDNITSKNTFEQNLFAIKEDKPTITYDIPIAVLNINLTDSSTEGVKNFFVNFFTKSYSEGDQLNNSGSYRISIDWYKEGESHSQENANIDNDIIFILKLQGSSTGQFKSKNFNITSSSTSGDNSVILWTPNFEKDNYDSFLPEETFTFKADVVDSTHANNTSIGLFVNKNTTKFADAQVNNSKYSKYIKNCLLGFPVLIFFNLNNEYYYMGIYNCNLGRDSLLNLGYYDIHNALDYAIDNNSSTITLNDGFGIYRINNDNYQPISENGEISLSVAEIQGGSNYFDFSQYDDTILFDTVNESGQTTLFGMFGDYYPSNERGIRNTKQKLKKLVEGISYSGGYLFNYIGKNFSEDELDNYGYTYGYQAHRISNGIHYWTESINSVPNYRHIFKQRIGSNGKEYIHTGEHRQGEITDVFTLLGYDNSEEEIDKIEYKHNAPNTFYRLLDYTSIVEYYTICMGFGLVDSVAKNLNLKSFKESGPFYVAFYDMDTGLGRSNSGSDVTPFAFSDYWTKFNGMDIIYRDFYPNVDKANENNKNNIPIGYDVPSSYLFAIAKYANLLGITKTPGFTTAPKTMWAKFRQNSNSPLANAESFINNYFGINLNKIPKFLFNMNYRFKYFQRRKNAFDSKNKQPFHGRGKFYLRNWLTKRFHLLDAYFNIIDFINPFKIYDKTTNKWTNKLINPNDPNTPLIELNKENIIPGENISLTNTDIYIIKNIFANSLNTGVGLKGSAQSAKIKALEYSPMIFKWPQSYLFFLCLDQDTEYSFNGPGTDTGVLSITFGGSIAWTYCDTLDPFIDNDGILTLDNAKYLENINIISGDLKELNLNNVKSLKDITITSSGAKCSLDGKLDGNSNYPNLRKIDLHNSACTLTIMNSPVKEINLSNINSESTTSISQALKNKVYSITQCNNLSSVKLNNMYAKSLNINPVWSNNIEISDSGIKELQLTANAAKYPDSTISILNNGYVEKVVLTDFKHINIENCPKLKDIVILQSNINVETLHIIGCNRAVFDDKSTEYVFEDNLLNIYIDNVNNNFTDSNGTIDLELLSNLKHLSLNNTLGFKHIYLPDANVILDQYCFANTQLNKLSRHTTKPYEDVIAIVGGDSLFMNAKYTFNTDNNTQMKGKFGILNTVQSMENMFAHNDGLKYEANEIMTSMFSFINTLVIFEDNDTKSDDFTGALTFVQNVAGMFYNQNISIKFDNNYTNGVYNNLLSRLTNVTNVSNMFFGNKDFNVLTKEMLGDFCLNTPNNLDLTDFIPNLKYIKKNTFWNLLPKINGNFITSKSYPVTLTVVDNINNIELNEVKLSELFIDPETITEETKITTITSICGLNFTNPTLDFENLFNYLPNLKTIINSFGSTGNINIAKNLNSCGLKNLNILQITNSFLFSGVDERINIYNFLNWEKIEILGQQENRDKPDLLLFDKSITQEDFETIGSEISLNKIDYVFQQCAFDNNNSNQFIIPETYSNITSINHTFKKISMIVDGNYNAPVKLSTETFPINHKIAYMDYAFYGITLTEGLCTNLFNLRTDDNFTYKKQILSMQYCFANIIVKKDPWWVLKNNERYEDFGLNTPNGYINCSSIDSKPSYIATYIDIDNSAKIYIYDDNSNDRNTIFNITDTSTKLINFNINNPDYGGTGAENHYILPYDIFYASANGGCKIDSCFAIYDNIYNAGHFIGILPDNLFNPNIRDVNNYNKENKSNLYIVSLSDVFKNLFIIPNKFNTDSLYENDEDTNINKVIKTNIYVYIPKHFFNFNTKPLSYSNVFSFIINFPEDTYTLNKFSYNMCYLLYEDTFNESMTSFENIFALTYYPLVYTDDHGGIQYQSTQLISRYSYNIRIGYMINDDMYLKAKEGIKVNTLNDNNEYEIVKQPITRIVYDGIDIKKYLNTYNILNGAFNSNMLDIMMGYMIRPKHYNSAEKMLEEYMINTMSTGGYVAQGSSIYTLYLSISKFILFTKLNNKLDIIKFIMGGLSMNSNVNLYSYQIQPGYVRSEYDNNNEIELPNINNTYEFTVNGTSYTIKNSLLESLTENSIDINDIIEDPIILYWKRWNEEHN